MSLYSVDSNNLIELLRVCVNLQELVLYNLRGVRVNEVVAAQYQETDFEGAISHKCPCCGVIRELLGLLCRLGVNGFVYAREEGRLKLSSKGEVSNSCTQQMTSILRCYSSLEELSLESLLDHNITDMLTNKFGGTLKTLTVRTYVFALITLLLQRCGGSLRHLSLDYSYMDACPLALIADTCPILHTLSLRMGTIVGNNLEHGFTSLFGACTYLTEFTLYRVAERDKALQPIITQRLRVRLLRLVGPPDEADAAWFRHEVREQQLLPVPMIVTGGWF